MVQEVVESAINTALTKIEQVAPAVAKPLKAVNRVILENPKVESVASQIIVPTTLATAAVAASATATIPSFLPFLQYLFTQPLLLATRRKRKSWGTVYNAVSKLPMDLAIVRLYDSTDGRLVQTRVTDKYGRFVFLPPPGSYRIEVVKPNYQFPSLTLKDRSADVQYASLYHGETVTISAPGTMLAPNIPLDPNIKEETPKAIIRNTRLRRANLMLGALSIGTSGAAFLIIPRPLALIPIIAHITLYGVFKHLAIGKKPKNLRRVKDADTRSPLAGAIARIFDTQFNKLLETQVTDRSGRYGFLAGPNEYYVAVEKPGYDKVVTPPINLRDKAEPEIVSLDVGLKKNYPV